MNPPAWSPGAAGRGEVVFAEPWEARAFAITVSLHERGLYSWAEWADALATRIKAAQEQVTPTSVTPTTTTGLAHSKICWRTKASARPRPLAGVMRGNTQRTAHRMASRSNYKPTTLTQHLTTMPIRINPRLHVSKGLRADAIT